MKTFFIAGTDTGVGKTVVAAAMTAALRLKGYSVSVMKPVSCGGQEDARVLMKAAGSTDPIERVNPIALKHPLSPHVAARLEKRRLDLGRLAESLEYFRKKRPDFLIVEGCGGLLVPITDDFWVIDLIPRLKARPLLVSRSGLGAINHTLLSAEALQHRKIRLSGVLFNRTAPGPLTTAEKTNPGAVARLVKAPVLGVLPFLRPCESDCAGKAFLKSMDLAPLLC